MLDSSRERVHFVREKDGGEARAFTKGGGREKGRVPASPAPSKNLRKNCENSRPVHTSCHFSRSPWCLIQIRSLKVRWKGEENTRGRDEIWKKRKHVRTYIRARAIPYFSMEYFSESDIELSPWKRVRHYWWPYVCREADANFPKISPSNRTFRSFVSIDFSYHGFLFDSSPIENRISIFPCIILFNVVLVCLIRENVNCIFPTAGLFLKKSRSL